MEISNLSILYVDDDELITRVIKRFLDRRYAEVHIALSAEDAINIYSNISIDIVITDIHLPDKNGFDLIEMLLDQNPEVVAAAISSDATEDTLLKVLRGGFYDFIKKPIDTKRFQNQLHRLEKTVQIAKKLKVQENELKQYKEMVDKSVLTCRTDLDGVVVDVNDFYAKTYGYTSHELIGHTHKKLRHPSTPSSQYKKLWHHLKSDEPYRTTIINKTKNGKTRVVDHIISPWYDEQGNKIGYYDIGSDITDLYKQKQKSKQQSIWFQGIINQLPDIIAVTDEKEMLYINNALLAFSGYDILADFKKEHKSICELFENSKDYVNNDWLSKAIIATAEGSNLKIKMKNRSDNSMHSFNISVHQVNNGKHYIMVFHDDTKYEIEREQLMEEVNTATWELMDTQSTLGAQLERFEHAINSSRDGFWDLDMRSNEFFLSPGWKKRLGFEKDEVITYKDYTQLINKESITKQVSKMLDLMESTPDDESQNLSFVIQYTLTTKSGEEIIIDDIGDVLFNEDKKPYRMVGFHRDISRQESQRKVLQSQNRLASLGEMISNIAHQWRQPVAAINTVVNDLEFEMELDDLDKVDSERVLQVGNDIKVFTKHLSKTIDDFRNFVKTDRKKEEFSLLEAIESANSIIEHSYIQSSIDYDIRYSIDENIQIFGFPRELSQVIINILNNAKDALVENNTTGRSVWIDVKIETDGTSILIEDNAGGIPEDIMKKVFDPYFTTKHESIGTGIGLSMSKNIIDTHFDGNLSVSNTSEGALFTIFIPTVG